MWKRGRRGAEAEGMTCTMLPRSHLNPRAGGAPRLGWEPNEGSAAPEQGISPPGHLLSPGGERGAPQGTKHTGRRAPMQCGHHG